MAGRPDDDEEGAHGGAHAAPYGAELLSQSAKEVHAAPVSLGTRASAIRIARPRDGARARNGEPDALGG